MTTNYFRQKVLLDMCSLGDMYLRDGVKKNPGKSREFLDATIKALLNKIKE